MDRIIKNALLTLGCDDKEIRLYTACYARGAAQISELIAATHLRRSTAYLVIKSLHEKELVREDHKAYGKTYIAAEPEVLVRLVAAKQRQIGRQHIALTDHMDELLASYGTSDIRPQVRTYQGTNGLLTVWRDILTATSEILIWTNQATESKLFNTVQHDQFIAERRTGGHFARVLAVQNAAGEELQRTDAENLRTTKLLPPPILFSAETYIYDQKIAVLDYSQDIIGIITESRTITEAYRAMFETAWYMST